MTIFNPYIYISQGVQKLLMSFKDKIMNISISHPKLVTFGIGLAVTFAIGLAIGMVDHNQAFAVQQSNTNNGGNAAAFNR
jgi:hypothetical protein